MCNTSRLTELERKALLFQHMYQPFLLGAGLSRLNLSGSPFIKCWLAFSSQVPVPISVVRRVPFLSIYVVTAGVPFPVQVQVSLIKC